jgi:hypothetical protein
VIIMPEESTTDRILNFIRLPSRDEIGEYNSSKWTLLLLGLFLFGFQAMILMPSIENYARVGEEPDRNRVDHVIYIDEDNNSEFDEDIDTEIDSVDEAEEGDVVRDEVVTRPFDKDAGILTATAILFPLTFVLVLLLLIGPEDSPVRIGLWIAIGYSIPIILYTILLLIVSLAFALTQQALDVVGGAIGSTVDAGKDIYDAFVSTVTLGYYGDDSSSSPDSDAYGDEGTGDFLSAQWQIIRATGITIFMGVLAIFLVVLFVAIGIKGGDSTTQRLSRGWIFGIVAQLIIVFGLLALVPV